MRSKNILIFTMLILSLALNSCVSAADAPAVDEQEMVTGSSQEVAAEDEMQKTEEELAADMMGKAGKSEEIAVDSEAASEKALEMSTPDWFDVALTDVQTGQSFTINELDGKVVLIETMAMWCSNCLKQQKEVLALHEKLGEREDFISLGFDIDPYEEDAGLKSYVEKNGFFWPYVITGADLARELGNLYGSQYVNPPSTPMLIIDRGGEVHLLPFGIKNADTLQDALKPFLEEPV